LRASDIPIDEFVGDQERVLSGQFQLFAERPGTPWYADYREAPPCELYDGTTFTVVEGLKMVMSFASAGALTGVFLSA
jgi:hypothetical protein